MWDEEREIFDDFDDQDADLEFIDDLTDVALDASEFDEDAPEEAFDEENLYDDED
ncbi:MAG: hypothetical protein JXM79_07265 [Sedimentisphaerales bacterium]|nr:hypothetical protein [Sedimentisphaerales bacterium]